MDNLIIRPLEEGDLDEADRVTLPEAALRVVARRRSHGPGPHPFERLGHRRRVLGRATPRIEADGSGQSGLRRARRNDRHRLVG